MLMSSDLPTCRFCRGTLRQAPASLGAFWVSMTGMTCQVSPVGEHLPEAPDWARRVAGHVSDVELHSGDWL